MKDRNGFLLNLEVFQVSNRQEVMYVEKYTIN